MGRRYAVAAERDHADHGKEREEMVKIDHGVPGAEKSTWFVTPNLTPAKNSTLRKFPDRETFVARFRVGGRHYPGSPMPWEAFARMSVSDIAVRWTNSSTACRHSPDRPASRHSRRWSDEGPIYPRSRTTRA